MHLERFSIEMLKDMLAAGIMADGKTEIALSRYLQSIV